MNNHNTWVKGLTWTPFLLTTTTNPDGSIQTARVHAGLFLWFQIPCKSRYLEVYAGFRPTPVWSVGFGNEGDGVFTKLGQWLKKKGWGNLGFACRIKRNKVWEIQ